MTWPSHSWMYSKRSCRVESCSMWQSKGKKRHLELCTLAKNITAELVDRRGAWGISIPLLACNSGQIAIGLGEEIEYLGQENWEKGLGSTYETIRKLVKTFWGGARGHSQYCRHCAVSVKLIDSLVPPMNFDEIMPQFILRILEGGEMHSLCLPGIRNFYNSSTHY